MGLLSSWVPGGVDGWEEDAAETSPLAGYVGGDVPGVARDAQFRATDHRGYANWLHTGGSSNVMYQLVRPPLYHLVHVNSSSPRTRPSDRARSAHRSPPAGDGARVARWYRRDEPAGARGGDRDQSSDAHPPLRLQGRLVVGDRPRGRGATAPAHGRDRAEHRRPDGRAAPRVVEAHFRSVAMAQCAALLRALCAWSAGLRAGRAAARGCRR